MEHYLSLFLEMLAARGLSKKTIRSYQTYIKPYLLYLEALRISPEEAPWSVIRDFLSFIKKKRSLNNRTVNTIISQIQFFHIYVLHKQWDPTQVPFRKFQKALPFVPSRELVRRFLDSIDDPKMYLAVSMLYATGLRLDELCHLKVTDIYLSSGKVHVRESKNGQDRYVPLPPSIQKMLCDFWLGLPKDQRPRDWLFTQQRSLNTPMDKQWVQGFILKQRKALGITDKLTAHSFRHAYATHSYENGMDLVTLKTFLGHKSLNSTTIYIHLASIGMNNVTNPFDQIGGGRHA